MRCRRFRQQLAAWLDGELPESLAAELALHRQQCADCAELATRMERAQAAVDAIPPLTPSPGFDEAFREKLLAARQANAAAPTAVATAPTRWWLRRPAFAGAAALLCVVTLAVVLGRRGVPPPRASRPDALELAQNFDLLRSYDVVTNLDALEDFELVKELGALEGQR